MVSFEHFEIEPSKSATDGTRPSDSTEFPICSQLPFVSEFVRDKLNITNFKRTNYIK